jgi:putative membrane protein
MSSYRSFAVAAALACAVGCGGGAERASDPREGGGGRDGLGDDARPTAAERTGATGGAITLSETDRQFVQKASQANQMEIRLGNLAEDKAANDHVKQYGEQLARDHEAANRELQSIGGNDTAQRSGGEMTTANEQMEQTQQKLERVSGPAFDRAYLEEMVTHHQHDIQEFERAAQSDNAQVRAFAERTLPTLRKHLEQAQQLQQSAGQGQRGDRQ